MGVASLVLGIAALALAAFPLVGYFGWILAVAGIVLGIVGLTRANHPHGLALSGTIVSGVAFLLATLFGIVYSVAFLNATTSPVTTAASSASPSALPSTEPSPSETPSPREAGVGSLGNPYPAGTTLDVSGTITAQLAFPHVNVSANDFVAGSNQFNDVPSSGMQWAVLDVTVTNSGTSPVRPGDLVYSINLATPDGQTFGQKFASLDNLLTSAPDLAPGASATGQIAYQLPVGTPSVLVNAGQSFVIGQ
ncbi:DUF4352 domain-containing protein [Leifsonia sp. McL0607]|uniref:DUF4352 domain-containing protein n=1 Tax=Leifsonia sp. McL0607 TaxID=3415672 RepID=UPI003CEF85E8